MKKTDLRTPFDKLWQGCDCFEKVFALQGEEFRNVKNRRTFRIDCGGKGFFVKIHRGTGWKEIIKNLLQFKLPVLGAGNEYRAIAKLQQENIPTMECAAFGERGWDPAAKESFLITRELTGTVSLEELAAEKKIDAALKKRLIRSLADSCGRMHRAGVNHRDCYICHFLLVREHAAERFPRLPVIDLHRAQIRKAVPFRYQVKDVAGLLFSSFDLPLESKDIWRFIKYYSRCRSLHDELSANHDFYAAVYRAARNLYRKEFKKFPVNDPLNAQKEGK